MSTCELVVKVEHVQLLRLSRNWQDSPASDWSRNNLVARANATLMRNSWGILSGVDTSDQVVATSVTGEWVASINVQVLGVVGRE